MIHHAHEERRVLVRSVLAGEKLGGVVEELVEHLPLDVTRELGFGRVCRERVHAKWL
jgi:hypothetical protein